MRVVFVNRKKDLQSSYKTVENLKFTRNHIDFKENIRYINNYEKFFM